MNEQAVKDEEDREKKWKQEAQRYRLAQKRMLQRLADKIEDERKQDEQRHAHERRRKDAGFEFLKDWPWEWFCSMNLPSECTHTYAEVKLKKWRIRLATNEKIQIAYLGIFNTVPHPHIHLVALGTNSMSQSLYDIDTKRPEKYWSEIARQRAVIKPITNNRENVYRYIADKNNPSGLSEMISPYNKKLLERKKIK